jgi:hypothetical protein
MKAIIFSKNRACQLHLLLESIEQYAPKLFSDIEVLYHSTSAEFKQGYKIVSENFTEVYFNEQYSFKRDTMLLMPNAKLVCFFVDDNFLYKQVDLTQEEIYKLYENPKFGFLSLRMGLNIEYQDLYSQQKLAVPKLYNRHNDDKLVFWQWKTCYPYHNYGYAFSVDGHIYRTNDILPGCNREFNNPNEFEGGYKTDHIPPVAASLRESVLVNNPLNLVGSSNNRAGEHFPHSLEELNQRYLDGQTISLDKLCQNKIVACHQEMEIEFNV